jgi:hypothetical protein
MSRAERSHRGDGGRDYGQMPGETAGIAACLRALAAQAERDPAFARHLGDALRASGLVPAEWMPAPAEPSAPAPDGGSRGGRASGKERQADQPLDPFVVLRSGGEAALRAALDALDLAALRRVVRAHHLDPNRVSARWSARERVIALIVEQVRARVNHGRSFERV